jgi:DNA-binding Lrp family transcriptional regulator
VIVAPAALQDVGTTAATHPHVALAVATSGTANLLLAVGCRDTQDLYRYLAHDLGPLPGVRSVETAPVIRNIKRAGTLLEPPTRGMSHGGASGPERAPGPPRSSTGSSGGD